MFASCQVIDQKCMTKITSEFSRLKGRCFLDNAGAALYPQSLLQHINEDLLNNVYMNPHTDKYTKDCIDQIRTLTLKHFNTDSSEYTVIFTSGTTQSLKLVVESFQFNCDESGSLNCGSFIYLQDNHTSVLGLREIAGDKNADIIHISHENFLELLNSRKKPAIHSWKERKKDEGNSLLVYSAQNNFNGYKYPLNIIENIKNGCLNNYVRKHLCKVNRNWYVLLDAASFIATNKLDLSITKPDFVCFSFYKLFGYPTGLGALLVKKSSEHILCQKRYFGGGTVDMVLSSEDFHVKRKSLSERFEDGTVPFLSILALKHCFDTINRLVPKVVNNDLMDTISHHTFNLAKDLYYQLKGLKHPNGRNAVALYMDTEFSDIRVQGGIVTFNVLREDGSYVGYAEFQHMADLFEINLRTGCFCNSGSCQRHLKASNKEMKDMYKAGHKCGDELDLVNGRPTGAVRASFGYYNTFQDVDRLVAIICKCYVRTKLSKPIRIMNQIYNNLGETPARENNTSSVAELVEDKMKKICESDYMSSDSIPYTALETNISLVEISIFPIKSCGAFKVKSAWKIGSKGFEYDREWMIVNDSGVCLTQKHNSRLCMIRPKIDLKKGLLKLDFRGKNSISVPLEPLSHLNNNNFSFCQSKVCTDVVKGIDCGDNVADWISEALETSYLRLVRQSRDDSRVCDKKGETERKLLSLSNQAQFLLINKATVRWLSDHIRDSCFDKDIDQLTDRFRGNLVVDMDQELVEREWQRLIIGKHEFKVEGQCRRCQMVCINQRTGEKTVEPLRTISEQFAGKMRFGIYLSYVGAVDGSKERMLTLNSPVQPLANEDDISRYLGFFLQLLKKNDDTPVVPVATNRLRY